MKEQKILDIQDKYKVGKRRALQMTEEVGADFPSCVPTSTRTPTHFVLRFSEPPESSNKQLNTNNPKSVKTINPFLILKALTSFLGEKPDNIRSYGEYYLIKVKNKSQSEKITQIKKVNGILCTVTIHDQLNTTKGLIFTQEYHYRYSFYERLYFRTIQSQTFKKQSGSRPKAPTKELL